MGNYSRKTALVTFGNLGLVGNGLPVLSSVPGQIYNFNAGQIIAYDPTTMLTINAAGVAGAKQVAIGVIHNDKGGILGTSIRHILHEDLDLCRTDLKINATAPECATMQIKDFEFSCATTGNHYMLQIEVNDYKNRGNMDEGQSYKYIFDASAVAAGCDSCSEEEANYRIACEFVRQINGHTYQDYPNGNPLARPDKPLYPFTAALKHTTTRTFTLATAAPGECEIVCAVKGLKDFTVDGHVLTFANVVDPQDATRTLNEQLDSVVAQMNAHLDLYSAGSAVLVPVDCCSFKIEVNTCLPTATMRYHDNAAVSVAPTDAFQPFTQVDPCIGCTPASPSAFAYGIRVFFHSPEMPCDAINPPSIYDPTYFGRSGTITAWGDGWNHSSYREITVQEQVIPKNSGYEVKALEFSMSNGGQGGNFTQGSQIAPGNFPRPMNHTAAQRASVAVCEKLYCVWSIVGGTLVTGGFGLRTIHSNLCASYVAIPVDDTVTVAAFQTLIAAVVAAGNCNVGNVTCI